jgi:hypothetical protein
LSTRLELSLLFLLCGRKQLESQLIPGFCWAIRQVAGWFSAGLTVLIKVFGCPELTHVGL